MNHGIKSTLGIVTLSICPVLANPDFTSWTPATEGPRLVDPSRSRAALDPRATYPKAYTGELQRHPDTPRMVLLDSFTRPDGPLGPDWKLLPGNPLGPPLHISSGRFTAHDPYFPPNVSAALFNTAHRTTMASVDVASTPAIGTAFVAVVLGYGDGSSQDYFIKVQRDASSTRFNGLGCYLGINGGGTYFSIPPFTTATMTVWIEPPTLVHIDFTKIDGGTASQSYLCLYSWAPAGTSFGIGARGAAAHGDNLTAYLTCGNISISPSRLPSGVSGTAYSTFLSAGGGDEPYSYTLSSGVLPAGLALKRSTGELSGIPTAAGPCSFVIQASDRWSCTGLQAYSLKIDEAPATVSNPLAAVLLRALETQ